VATGEVYSYTETITTSKSIYFPDAPYASILKNSGGGGGTAWVGSVKVKSDQDMVGIVNELSGSYLAASYTAFSSGTTDLYFPLAFVNAYGFANSSFSIADVSGTPGPVSVKVEYLADKGACPTCGDASFTYNFTTSDSQYQPTQLAGNAALGTGGVYVGSIHIKVNTAGKTINGIMNEVVSLAGIGDGFTSFDAFR
jgi:hypothetical protein